MCFSPGQCRIMLGTAIAVLALFFCRHDVADGSRPAVPCAAGGITRPPFAMEIAGAVARPAIYSFSYEANWAAAIREAGGLKKGACVPDAVLRAVPENGSSLFVGTDPAQTAVRLMDPQKRFLYFIPFSVNRAGVEELMLLPGIGEKTARAIVAYRERYGPFTRLESLIAVPGIGRRTFARMQAFLAL